jgi:transcriptional regulatory protein AMDR
MDIYATADGEYVFRRHLVEFIDQPQLTERPIDKHARMTYVGTDVSNISFLVQQQFGDKVSNICHFPANRIERRHACYDLTSLPVEAFQLPARAVVDRLLSAYFTHVNPGFPVVDETIFMKQYEARDSKNPPSLLLLHAILVVGAHICFDQPERESHKALFFRRAKILFDARFEHNRDTTVQAALLLTWHADGPEDVAANAWFWLGVAVRTAMGMGMHRDTENSTLVAHNKAMWRRVWWLLFQCDTLVSLQYGRPQSIHLEYSDVQRPNPSDFQNCGPNVRVEYVIQATGLCIIISQALRERFCLVKTTGSRFDVLQKTDEALANWSLRLPSILQSQVGLNGDLWAANLQLIYNTALVLLHRTKPHPTLSKSRAHGEDSDICITAATVIQSVFQCLCQKDEIKYLWTSSINCLFTALIQLSVEVRLSNPILVISALRRYDSALSSLRELARYWPNAQSILHFFESSARLQYDRESSVNGENNSNNEILEMAQAMESRGGHSRLDIGQTGNESTALPVMAPHKEPLETQHRPAGEGLSTENLHGMESRKATLPQVDIVSRDYDPVGYDSWQEWLQVYWQQPEFPDEYLFTF